MNRGIRLNLAPARGARDGGVERYGHWLAQALAERGLLSATGVPFSLKARDGGEVVRTGDGVSAAWVEACGLSPKTWRGHVEREQGAVQAARRVVATSPMVAAELARFYKRSDAVVVLNPLIAPVAEPVVIASGALVFVGHGFERKGLARWLSVLAWLPGVHGHVVGNDQRPRRWRALAERMGLADRVHFHGAVEAAPFIAGAALLLHPAHYEPYGNVVAEAVAAGTPVVTSDAVGAACLLDPHHVWRSADGFDALRATVERALSHPRPPVRQPPSADAHIEALLAACA